MFEGTDDGSAPVITEIARRVGATMLYSAV
jgi:hypothetical protein